MDWLLLTLSKVTECEISGVQCTEFDLLAVLLKGDFADSEDTDPRRSHPGVFYIDVNSIPLSIVETFSINQRLCGMI
jgi:hypothetical protein